MSIRVGAKAVGEGGDDERVKKANGRATGRLSRCDWELG